MHLRSFRRQINGLLMPSDQPSLNVAFVSRGAMPMNAFQAEWGTPNRIVRRWGTRLGTGLVALLGLGTVGLYNLGQHPVPITSLPIITQGWVLHHMQEWPSTLWPSPVMVPSAMPVPMPTVSATVLPTGVASTRPVVSAADQAAEVRKRLEAARQARLLNRQESLADSISVQYYIAHEAALLIVQQAYQAAAAHDVDPLLLLAITGVESRFNPFAGSNAGALGLTQSMPGAHPDKMQPLKQRGGSILNVRDNLDLGAQILHEYLVRFHGNTAMALQQYNGNVLDRKQAYANRVFKALSPLKVAVEHADKVFKAG